MEIQFYCHDEFHVVGFVYRKCFYSCKAATRCSVDSGNQTWNFSLLRHQMTGFTEQLIMQLSYCYLILSQSVLVLPLVMELDFS